MLICVQNALRTKACCCQILKLYKVRALPRQLLTSCTNVSFMNSTERLSKREWNKPRNREMMWAEWEKGQAMVGVVLLGAWSVLTCNFNENNEERSYIRKQISKFLVTDGCQFGQSYSINNSVQDVAWCSTGCTKRNCVCTYLSKCACLRNQNVLKHVVFR